MAFVVPGNFFCIFKTGDNIRYNLKVLDFLYQAREEAGILDFDMPLKPIIIIEISIIEAILHDFHLRIRANRNEGVVGMSDDEMSYIRSKCIDEFEKYIASAKKHDFFDEADSDFYEVMNSLREVRNRIHIQNTKLFTPRDDFMVFTVRVLHNCEMTLEKVVKTIATKHPRPNYLAGYVGDLYFPWNEYYQ